MRRADGAGDYGESKVADREPDRQRRERRRASPARWAHGKWLSAELAFGEFPEAHADRRCSRRQARFPHGDFRAGAQPGSRRRLSRRESKFWRAARTAIWPRSSPRAARPRANSATKCPPGTWGQYRRGRADGLLPVQRMGGQLLWRLARAGTRRRRILHGQKSCGGTLAQGMVAEILRASVRAAVHRISAIRGGISDDQSTTSLEICRGTLHFGDGRVSGVHRDDRARSADKA